MRVLPAELFVLHQKFVVEEALSVIRHDLRNKLGSIRNGAFYVRRKLEKTAPEVCVKDPRVPEFLAMIASELDSAEETLQSRLPSAQHAEPVAAVRLLDGIAERVVIPATVSLVVEPAPAVRVCIPTDEATLAMCCVIQNAIDAIDTTDRRDGVVRLRASEHADGVALEVDDDGPGFAAGALERAFEPYFTTRENRLGVGLNIARRIALRWRGKLALAAQPRGVRAALVLEASR